MLNALLLSVALHRAIEKFAEFLHRWAGRCRFHLTPPHASELLRPLASTAPARGS
jgi:hypothetical protein